MIAGCVLVSAGVVALVVIVGGAVFDPVVSSTSKSAAVLSPWSWLRSVPCLMRWLLICSPGDGCGQIQQQERAGVVALVVVAVDAVFDPVDGSTRSTSKAGPVLSPWS